MALDVSVKGMRRKIGIMSRSVKRSLTIDFPTRWVSINNKHIRRASKPFSNPISHFQLIFHSRESAGKRGVDKLSLPIANNVASNYGTSKLINCASFTVCQLATSMSWKSLLSGRKQQWRQLSKKRENLNCFIPRLWNCFARRAHRQHWLKCFHTLAMSDNLQLISG